jgi:hypothetical protein
MTMTTGRFISQREALITKLESLVQSLPCSTLHPSDTQYETLGNLTDTQTVTLNVGNWVGLAPW